jgi:hypothetical protein
MPSIKRSTAKQDSFKKKLLRRANANKKTGFCDICNIKCFKLQGCHIIAVEKKEQELLHKKFKADQFEFPVSINDASNGLLLCPTCHQYFDSKEREIRINSTGKIIVSKSLCNASELYRKLNSTFIWWHEHIGKHPFPTSKLLHLHFKLKSRSKKLFSSESSEKNTEDSQEDEEDSQEDEDVEKIVRPVSKKRKIEHTKCVRFNLAVQTICF